MDDTSKVIVGGLIAGAAFFLLQDDDLPVVEIMGVNYFPPVGTASPQVVLTVNGIEWTGARLIINGQLAAEVVVSSNNNVVFNIANIQALIHEGDNPFYVIFLDDHGRTIARTNVKILTLTHEGSEVH